MKIKLKELRRIIREETNIANIQKQHDDLQKDIKRLSHVSYEGPQSIFGHIMHACKLVAMGKNPEAVANAIYEDMLAHGMIQEEER